MRFSEITEVFTSVFAQNYTLQATWTNLVAFFGSPLAVVVCLLFLFTIVPALCIWGSRMMGKKGIQGDPAVLVIGYIPKNVSEVKAWIVVYFLVISLPFIAVAVFTPDPVSWIAVPACFLGAWVGWKWYDKKMENRFALTLITFCVLVVIASFTYHPELLEVLGIISPKE